MTKLIKPLPVKIVEAIGWIYVALVVYWIIFLMTTVKTFDWSGGLISGSIMLSLPVSMVFSLRTGQRFGFIVPNTVVFLFPFLSSVFTTIGMNWAWVILSLILVVVPEVLLCLSSSRLWLREAAIESTKGRGTLYKIAIKAFALWPVILIALSGLSIMCG